MATDQDLDFEAGAEAPKKSKKLLIIILAAVVLVGAGVGATLFLIGGDEPEQSEDSGEAETDGEVGAEGEGGDSGGGAAQLPAQYIKLKPEFVVAYQVGPRQRFLQVYMEVMTRSNEVIDAIELHDPRIRSEIIRVMSAQKFEELRTPEGKVALRQAVTEKVREIVMEEAGVEGVEEVLFTNFVMQ